MNQYFTVKVKYTKQTEQGKLKRVTEPYLVAAATFGDAESRTYEELGSIIRGEFTVAKIERANFHDIFHYEDSDTWFKCRIKYEGCTQDSEKPKKVTQYFLVTANSLKQAYERIEESLSGMMVTILQDNIAI